MPSEYRVPCGDLLYPLMRFSAELCREDHLHPRCAEIRRLRRELAAASEAGELLGQLEGFLKGSYGSVALEHCITGEGEEIWISDCVGELDTREDASYFTPDLPSAIRALLEGAT